MAAAADWANGLEIKSGSFQVAEVAPAMREAFEREVRRSSTRVKRPFSGVFIFCCCDDYIHATGKNSCVLQSGGEGPPSWDISNVFETCIPILPHFF